jgi:ferric-dicitrate binding protein FerR (iron transport regulator)
VNMPHQDPACLRWLAADPAHCAALYDLTAQALCLQAAAPSLVQLWHLPCMQSAVLGWWRCAMRCQQAAAISAKEA